MSKETIYALIGFVVLTLIICGIAFLISSMISENYWYGFCIDHGYSQVIYKQLEGRAYCYRLERGTEIIVPVEEME